MVTTLYFVRSGQSTYGVEGLVKGQLAESEEPYLRRIRKFEGLVEPRLTLQGIRESTELSNTFSSLPLDVIYSSPLERAVCTAGIIAAKQSTHFVEGENFLEDDRLKERMMFHPGMTLEQINAHLDTDFKSLKDYGEADETGENKPLVQKRFSLFVNDIIARHTNKNVLVVSHGGIMRFGIYQGILHDKIHDRDFATLGITTLTYEFGKLESHKLNHTSPVIPADPD